MCIFMALEAVLVCVIYWNIVSEDTFTYLHYHERSLLGTLIVTLLVCGIPVLFTAMSIFNSNVYIAYETLHVALGVLILMFCFSGMGIYGLIIGLLPSAMLSLRFIIYKKLLQ